MDYGGVDVGVFFFGEGDCLLRPLSYALKTNSMEHMISRPRSLTAHTAILNPYIPGNLRIKSERRISTAEVD